MCILGGILKECTWLGEIVVDVCKQELCTGCFACQDICPEKCITMQEGSLGHIYPVCDESICIDCGLCNKVCQGLHPLERSLPKKTYAAWNKDLEEQKTSSSGGISALLAKACIQNGGVVYGAAFNEKWEVEHIRCTTEDACKKIRKSKYVQSHINEQFIAIKKDLTAGKSVIFYGTPCQVGGLNRFLMKPYENLLTVDLICHGAPSRKIYLEEIRKLAKMDGLKNITFRGNYGKGYGYGFGFFYENDIVKSFPLKQSYYIRGFMDGLLYRESCYTCPYANEKRVGDITLGDFWQIGKTLPFENPEKRRVSLVLVNNEKGEQWINKIKDNVFLEERSLDEAKAGNPQLRTPAKQPKNYKIFKKLYPKFRLHMAGAIAYPKMTIRLLLQKLHIVRK